MGFFDTILKDIADGNLDKKLEKLADTVEHLSTKVDTSVKKIAEQPEKITDKISEVGSQVRKTIEVNKD